ncbi:hypothetical protein [Rhodoblastus sp.]|uniref:hypothetical protein n=1 Tax=Rhodoblastus sp. TaxID=1962975 RepID=UPI003F9C6026
MAIHLKAAKDGKPGFGFDDGNVVDPVQSFDQTLIDFKADLPSVMDAEFFDVTSHDIGFELDFFTVRNHDDQGRNGRRIIQSQPTSDRTALIRVNIEKHLPSIRLT